MTRTTKWVTGLPYCPAGSMVFWLRRGINPEPGYHRLLARLPVATDLCMCGKEVSQALHCPPPGPPTRPSRGGHTLTTPAEAHPTTVLTVFCRRRESLRNAMLSAASSWLISSIFTLYFLICSLISISTHLGRRPTERVT